jgi:hypothetical protein
LECGGKAAALKGRCEAAAAGGLPPASKAAALPPHSKSLRLPPPNDAAGDQPGYRSHGPGKPVVVASGRIGNKGRDKIDHGQKRLPGLSHRPGHELRHCVHDEDAESDEHGAHSP